MLTTRSLWPNSEASPSVGGSLPEDWLTLQSLTWIKMHLFEWITVTLSNRSVISNCTFELPFCPKRMWRGENCLRDSMRDRSLSLHDTAFLRSPQAHNGQAKNSVKLSIICVKNTVLSTEVPTIELLAFYLQEEVTHLNAPYKTQTWMISCQRCQRDFRELKPRGRSLRIFWNDSLTMWVNWAS